MASVQIKHLTVNNKNKYNIKNNHRKRVLGIHTQTHIFPLHLYTNLLT